MWRTVKILGTTGNVGYSQLSLCCCWPCCLTLCCWEDRSHNELFGTDTEVKLVVKKEWKLSPACIICAFHVFFFIFDVFLLFFLFVINSAIILFPVLDNFWTNQYLSYAKHHHDRPRTSTSNSLCSLNSHNPHNPTLFATRVTYTIDSFKRSSPREIEFKKTKLFTRLLWANHSPTIDTEWFSECSMFSLYRNQLYKYYLTL